MAETLPTVETPIQNTTFPVINYTGVQWPPIILAVCRCMKDTPNNGIITHDPNAVVIETLYYYERIGGLLETLECNMTHCPFGFEIHANHLTSFKLEELVVGNGYINGNLLTTLSLPKLIRTPIGGGLDFSSINLQTLSLPNLELVDSFFTMLMPALTTLSVPKLKTMGQIYWFLNMLTNINLPALENVGGDVTIYADRATSITAPMIKKISGNLIIHAAQATLVTFSNIKSLGGNVTIDTNLNSGAVADILVWLYSLDGTNGTTLYENKNINIQFGNSAPNLLGAAIANLLRTRGCTVTTN